MVRCVHTAPSPLFEPATATDTHLRLLTRRWEACARVAWSTVLATAGICGPSLGLAQTTNKGAAICTAADIQSPSGLARMDAGSTIITWYDARSGNYDVYAQRVDDGGLTAWQRNGVPVCTAPGDQYVTSTVPDGAGGAILFWYDSRNGMWDIYAQRVDANGNSLWATNGVPVCVLGGDQLGARAIPDGAGGAVVCWYDLRSGTNFDVYAQRVSSAGVPQWTVNGVALCTAAGDQSSSAIVSDGGGGAIVIWYDHRGGSWDIYAARITATGLTPWTPDGVAVCVADGDQLSPIAVPGGLGGATIAWNDSRNVSYSNVVAQRINADGLSLWTANGVPVAPQSASQYPTTLVEDDAGGTIIGWTDYRTGVGDVYAQRLDGGGVSQWTAGGLPVCTAPGYQNAPFGVRDGSGGAILVWSDGRSDDAGDIFAQRIDHDGTALWGINGVPVTIAKSGQYQTFPVADGNGGVVTAWSDYRLSSVTNYDVYAQRMMADGRPAFPDADTPRITGVRDVPNDQGGRVFVTWFGSALDAPDLRTVTGYRVWRRIPEPAQGSAVVAAEESPVSEIVTRREQRSAASGIEVTYWEAVATLPAERLQGYGFTAATTQDSIAESNPYTAFFVTALTADPFSFYQSDIDSGYSVDNLSPPMPVPFAATYSATANVLHWTTSRAHDLREFRLHRGSAPDFVPGPSNLLAANRDTGYVDVPGASYYKLAAVDVHGNLSRYALVTPTSPVATLAALVSVDAQNDRVRLVWYAADGAGAAVTVYRRTLNSDWASVDEISADGSGYLRYEDAEITSGTRYGYRLGFMDEGQEVFAGEVWVEVPVLRLALRGATPNPAVDGRLRVEFTLGGQGPARIELIDIAGRIVRTAEVGSLGPGTHSFELAGDSPIGPGIYFLRLRQGGGEVRARIAVID